MFSHHVTNAQSQTANGRCARLRRWQMMLLIVLMFGSIGQPLEAQVNPDKVKAVYLYNFGNYVEWPQLADGKPFVIGVVAKSHTIHNVLKVIADRKKLKGRTIKPVLLIDEKAVADCRIVYIPDGTSTKLRDAVLARAKNKPVLIVGESPNFANETTGGMIRFYPDRSAIRFEINPGTIQKARLKASSKLIQLGTVIRD